MDFGEVQISDEQKQFCDLWSDECILLYKSLPESTQADATLFFAKYARTRLAGFNLFRMYYAPAWSIIYWLMQLDPDSRKLSPQDRQDAKIAHFMAMFLHALDDHLNDHQIAVTHLTLLLRSQSWVMMNTAMDCLAAEVESGPQLVSDLIDDYYASIGNSNEAASLDSYCDLFRQQMATWQIVPAMLTRRLSEDEEFSAAIQRAYGSFGIAWRLLDDVQDIKADMINGITSCIYVCLPNDMRQYWKQGRLEEKKSESEDRAEIVCSYIMQNNIIEHIKARICRELISAAAITDDCSLPGLANEFRSLLRPLQNGQEDG